MPRPDDRDDGSYRYIMTSSNERWEFSQHPLVHQNISLWHMWIQDKRAAEISIPIWIQGIQNRDRIIVYGHQVSELLIFSRCVRDCRSRVINVFVLLMVMLSKIKRMIKHIRYVSIYCTCQYLLLLNKTTVSGKSPFLKKNFAPNPRKIFCPLVFFL